MKSRLLLAMLAIVVAGICAAHENKDAIPAIKFRQSGYTFMAWNMGKLKSMLIDHPDSFNKEQAVAAANVIQAVANSGMGALYVPGSDKGRGWEKTRVKPALFSDKEGAAKVASAFNREANELARVAATGDAAVLKVQFGKVGESCKACHDKFRAEEHEHDY